MKPNIRGGSAFKVKYLGPEGRPCPDAIVTLALQDDVTKVAQEIRATLLRDRGGMWTDSDIHILSVEYFGPWFNGAY